VVAGRFGATSGRTLFWSLSISCEIEAQTRSRGRTGL